MFDVYVHAHAVDPRARTRMMALVGGAAIVTTTALAGFVTVQKLGIRKVGAPSIEHMLVLPLDVGAAPLTPPPPPPGPSPDRSSASATDPETPPDRDVHDDAPLERAKPSPTRDGTHRGPDVGEITGRGPIGPLHPGTCPVPGACANVPRGTKPTPPLLPSETRVFVPIASMEEAVLFSPDPSEAALQRTPAGMAKRGGTSSVAFCIDTDGQISSTRTRRSAGDGDVDRICRETVARWRFRPFRVDGIAHATCSEVTFQIAFE